jgi:hypothetical protein
LQNGEKGENSEVEHPGHPRAKNYFNQLPLSKEFAGVDKKQAKS